MAYQFVGRRNQNFWWEIEVNSQWGLYWNSSIHGGQLRLQKTVNDPLGRSESDVQMAMIRHRLVSGASERTVRTRQGAVSAFKHQGKDYTVKENKRLRDYPKH